MVGEDEGGVTGGGARESVNREKWRWKGIERETGNRKVRERGERGPKSEIKGVGE